VPLRQGKPVHQALQVQLPPHSDPLPRGGPWCYCGKTWTDTPRRWAAADRHNEKDLPQCGEALRERGREWEKTRRQVIAADPVLATRSAHTTRRWSSS
jgi:hypothetical protein